MRALRHLIALLTCTAGLALSGAATGANDAPASAEPVALGTLADTAVDMSAQRHGGGGGRGGVGRIGGGARIGGQGRIGQGRVGGRIDGRVGGRIDGRVGGRIGRIDGRIGRIGYRVGYRYGYRYGRIGRIGFVPVPVPLPPGPGGVVVPQGVVPAAPCPVCPVQACLITVYSEQNLTGQSFETRDNQPRLDLSQWQNQIASIIVKGGTWDFFPDLEFRGGPPLRLAPGSYGLLEPQWTKRIGSFMCVR